MLVNRHNIHSISDETDVIIPQRSYLYCLEPIGIGTALVECLTSYLSRLAQAHLVHPKEIIIKGLFPIFERAYLPSKHDNNNLTAFWKDSATLNSLNVSTNDWVHALEKLTLRSDLRCLTMLTWSDVLSSRYLLRSSKAWCSSCYREWRESDTQTYEPLLWMLDAVTICTRHNRYLEMQCVNQKCERRLSMLASQDQLGYCNYCSCWLGELTGRGISRIPSEDELKWQEWVVEVVGELVAIASVLPIVPRRWTFAEAVAEYLDNAADGNVSALARKLQVSRRTIRDWKKGVQVPQLNSLLQFCYLCGIRPLHLFRKDSVNDDLGETNKSVLPDSKRLKKHYRVFPTDHIRHALETELLQVKYLPRPMSVVAKHLNYDPSFLSKHFPDLCHSISERYREYRKQQRNERRQKIFAEVRQTTYKVHEQGLYPSHERVRLLLTEPALMREPGALAVWHETLKELGLGIEEP